MIEELAQASCRNVPRETFEKIEAFAAMLREENQRQNLVSQATLDQLWQRHILDSAQLLRFAPDPPFSWADIGSGAGLPGLVIAILSGQQVALIEPRRLRADFLLHCIERLSLPQASVAASKAERLTATFDVLSARAVASVDQLFAISRHLAHPGTRWILPKGRSGAKELAVARRTWQGRFRAEASVTDHEAVILIAEGVEPRGGTSR